MDKKSKLKVIGPRISVDLPKFGIQNIPAKVDTGADSSSIWASNIKEKNGTLSFILFAPTSPFYTGKEITTRDFEVASIKNSFGHTEIRYKVTLGAVIEGKPIKIRFSLSNRSENSYPILIGRRTLHGRFLVDVSKAGKKYFNVLILKPRVAKSGGSFHNFFDELGIQNPNIKFTLATYKDLEFIFRGKKLNVKLNGTRKDLANFDLVYFMVVSNYKDISSAAAQYLRLRGTPYLDRAAADYYQSLNKLHQYIILQSYGVRAPKTIFMDPVRLAGSYAHLKNELGSPFILKDIYGRKGRGNYLIKTHKQFDDAVSEGLTLVAQKFIANDGDYRILIFGRQINMIIKRKAEKGSHLNNISSAASAELIRETALPAAVKRMAVNAATALHIDISGVDMVQDKASGLWYCLEVNESPQLVSSSFLDEKQQAFAQYLHKRLNKL